MSDFSQRLREAIDFNRLYPFFVPLSSVPYPRGEKNGRIANGRFSSLNVGEKVKTLRYFGFSREDFDSGLDELKTRNLKSVSLISGLSSLMIFILAWYPSANGGKSVWDWAVAFSASAVELAVFFYSRMLRKKGGYTGRMVHGLGFFSLFVIFAYAAYVWGISRNASTVDNFLIFFFMFETVLVFDFQHIIALNVAVVAGIAACEFLFPYGTQDWVFDFASVLLCATVATALTWYSATRVIGEIVAQKKLEEERNQFHEESLRDQLTGLANRRSYEQSVDFYISVCHHVHQTVCVVMLDVDFFKLYNDFYGHLKGDEVLKAIGNALKELSEEERLFSARVGGEEFIVLWTENRVAEAERVARRLQQKIIDLQIRHEKSSVAKYVTASIGLYMMRGGSNNTEEELYEAADSALYHAKADGRNCIVLHDSQDSSFRPVILLPPELNIGRR